MYETKNDQYFAFVRKDIAPLLPASCGSVLELGCGGGATLAWLKSSGRASHTTGMELCAEPASRARTCVDRVIDGDLDETIGALVPGSFDLVLCLDVLEHLVDPWATVKQLHGLVRPGGSIIVSLPNVGHHSVVLPLLTSGRWRYEDAGIMDRTHLRFFTRKGARELLTQGGFEIAGSVDTGVRPTRLRECWKYLLAGSPWRDLGVFQFLISATRPDTADAASSAALTPALA
jgi:2-polyprenyl-3-methyl-5-hydroxy-6-metoxy-1,4-benzoquinol methylase